jgi:hypothetical protein
VSAQALPSEREFERTLMRDAGFSRSQARAILGAGYKALLSRQDAGGGLDDLAARIRRVAALIAGRSPGAGNTAGD